MSHRKAYATQSLLDVVWVYVAYLEARLLCDQNAKDLAPKVTPLLDKIEKAAKGQRDKHRGIIGAQAKVDEANYWLDKSVIRFSRALLNTEEIEHNAEHPHYKLYYTTSPSRIERMGLEAEVLVVRPWLASLKGETDPTLLGFASLFEGNIIAGDAALQTLEAAKSGRQEQRVREIIPLIKEVNDVCKEVYGTLTARTPSLKMPEGWAGGFFYKTRRNEKPDDPAEAFRVALYAIFSARQIDISDDVDTKIQEEKSIDALQSWMNVAPTAKSAEDVVGLIEPA